MFSQNNFRPALAGVGSDAEKFARKGRYESMMLDGSQEADDFNSFGSVGDDRPRRSAPQRSRARKSAIDPKWFFIAGGALLALILVIVLVVAVASGSSNGDIVKQNNTYVSYVAGDGSYHVAQNGKSIGAGFENEITVKPAADNSFAYVVEHSPDGEVVYILEDQELTELLISPAMEVLHYAEFNPGVIYTKEKGIYYSTPDSDERLSKDPLTSSFVISPDGSAVAYTEPDDDNLSESRLYLKRIGSPKISLKNNIVPVAVAEDGKYVYGYRISAEDMSRQLYLITIKNDESEEVKIEDGNFVSINYANTKGTEIIYTIGSLEGGYRSYVYNVKKDEPIQIGQGVLKPLIADPTIVRLGTLKGAIVENTLLGGTTSATYLLDKKYDSRLISRYNGKLNSEGDIFYFIDNNDTLNAIDLTEKTFEPIDIYSDVSDFAVTRKDNLYILVDDTLIFYKSSTKTPKGVSEDVTDITFYDYANTLYFICEDEPQPFTSEEGSPKESIKFGRTEVAANPVFVDGAQKKTFAYTYDETSGHYNLYYTSNGKSFKLIAADCSDVNGASLGFVEDIQDALEDLIDSVS